MLLYIYTYKYLNMYIYILINTPPSKKTIYTYVQPICMWQRGMKKLHCLCSK